ncbi:hypothetical protein RhiirA1_467267 [Rhizophagus irregularis]|uniref:Uncharacterized protein n=1 Tax=Rhizophagus irregularis TaxID=588596 RepID=A0A2I1F1F4_9GLOM|nr:hypothetical protein RhiirA1_467267 [Rhizophagus irregularis]PKY28210.1 hypothetical protein RhiirB3_444265 [Rhizophagus irregularis]
MFELNQDVIYLIFKELEDVTNLFIHVFLLAEHGFLETFEIIIFTIYDDERNEHCFSVFKYFYCDDESKTLEESLIKCADTIQYLRIFWKPFTKSLLYLKLLEHMIINEFNWNKLFKILTRSVPISLLNHMGARIASTFYRSITNI